MIVLLTNTITNKSDIIVDVATLSQWRSKGEATGRRASGRRSRGRINTLYPAIKKRILCRNIDQSMPKMCIFV